MNEERYKKILQIVAEKEGVSEAQAEQELQELIDEVYDAMNEPLRQVWSDLEFQGKRPSVKIFIENVLDRM